MKSPIAVIDGDRAAPMFKMIPSSGARHVLIVPHSRIFELSPIVETKGYEEPSPGLIATLANTAYGEVPLSHVVAPEPQSISLNVSSSCNLSCSYCYASQGSFQGLQPAPMSWEVAKKAIDKLLGNADPLAPITIGFLGGEPFLNRRLIYRVVEYATEAGRPGGLDVRFSVTTNGTTLTLDDIELLRSYHFAVTVSIDGGEKIQNLQRPAAASSRSSFEQLIERTQPLLVNPGLAKVAARATVRRDNLELRERFEDILAIGFQEVGFAPLRVASGEEGALRDGDWVDYREAIVEIAKSEIERIRRGLSVRFTNLAVALKQIHRGASSPYPCGAGGGYFSVSANGDWYACHRAIGTPEYKLGNNEGLDSKRRLNFLSTKHVHSQSDCSNCWARYLCSGGCHQEASSRSLSSCGFIRDWLEFCLTTYCELSAGFPDFFNYSQNSAGELE